MLIKYYNFILYMIIKFKSNDTIPTLGLFIVVILILVTLLVKEFA